MRRRIAAFLLAVAVLISIVGLYLAGKFRVLTIDRKTKIQVNGRIVSGELLTTSGTAIVTIRDRGKKRSYRIVPAGDIDMVGNMGYVIDCHQWTAPRLPVLIEFGEYPRCEVLPEDGVRFGYPLIWKGGGVQFVNGGGDKITLIRQ
jgi:hypothetical protein